MGRSVPPQLRTSQESVQVDSVGGRWGSCMKEQRELGTHNPGMLQVVLWPQHFPQTPQYS